MQDDFDPLDPLGLFNRMKKTRDIARKVIETIVAITDSVEELLDEVREIKSEIKSLRELIEEYIGGDADVSFGEDSERSNERSRRKVRKSR